MELIRTMEAGDVLVVRTRGDLTSRQINDIREAVLLTVKEIAHIRILIIPDEYLADISKLPLGEMFKLRQALDHAIYHKTKVGSD